MTMPNPQLDLSQNTAGQQSLASGGWPSQFGPTVIADGVAYFDNPGGGVTTSLANPPVTAAPPVVTNNPPAQPALTPQQQDAFARLNAILNQYGLGALAAWIKDRIIAGASDAQIMLELRDQPAFKARFPAIEARRAAGLTPLDPTQILAYEQQASQLMRMAGLPDSFASSAYVQGLLSNDVSIAELSARIEQGFLRVSEAPEEVRQAFQRYFGVNGDQALAALFLDPDKSLPELEKMAMTSFVGGIGSRFGVNLGMSKAREIADTGLSEAAVWQGYRQLDTLAPLFTESIGESVDLQAEVEGVDAVFGTRPGAEATLDRRRRTRANAFGGTGQGGAYATQRGVVGLGVADG